MRAYSKRRIAEKESPSITFDSLKQMERTGLLTEDELEKARQAVKKYFLQQMEEEKKLAESRHQPLIPLTPEEIARQNFRGNDSSGVIKEKKKLDEEFISGRIGIKKTKEKSSKQQTGEKAIDVEALYKKGIISEEEYHKLTDFFEQSK